MKFSWQSANMEHPRLIITAEDPEFDKITLRNWKDEGYNVAYLPFDAGRKAFENSLLGFADALELGETYAIVGLLTLPVLENVAIKAVLWRIEFAIRQRNSDHLLQRMVKPLPRS